jgi:hypothetical protein
VQWIARLYSKNIDNPVAAEKCIIFINIRTEGYSHSPAFLSGAGAAPITPE